MNTFELHRVVVTGLGLVTPLGTGVEINWENVVAGRSGIRPITRFPNVEFFATRIAGEVPDFHGESLHPVRCRRG
jgi:3-oxoacyl-[acyl-carrier-protein] synthase II